MIISSVIPLTQTRVIALLIIRFSKYSELMFKWKIQDNKKHYVHTEHQERSTKQDGYSAQ